MDYTAGRSARVGHDSFAPFIVRLVASGLVLALGLCATPGLGVGQSAVASERPLRPLHDLGGALLDLGVDGWQVFSAPARLDGEGWLKVGGVVAVGSLLFLIDDEIQESLSEEPRSGFHSGLRDVGDFFEPLGLMGKTNSYYAGAATIAYFARQERLQLLFKELLYAHWISGATRQLVSRGVGRVRPRDGGTAGTFDRGEGKSFPSGHSSTITQVARVLSHHIDWTPATVALYGLAGTVLFQRVDSGAHWSSDAWFGAAWGLAVSSIVIAVEEDGRLLSGVAVGMAPSPTGPALQFTVPVGW